MTWLVDFDGYSVWNAPPVSTSLATLSILQNHYPERLGAAVCYHAPRLFSGTWAVSGGGAPGGCSAGQPPLHPTRHARRSVHGSG
jgi:hypothetical protein